MKTEWLGYHYRDFTFANILADKARKHGDKTFMTFLPDGRTYSYSDIDLLSNAMANALVSDGFGKCSHIAMLMENSPEQVLTYFALGKLGSVAVPINTAARGEFLRYYLNQSDSTALIVDAGLLPWFVAIADETSIARVYVLGEAEEAGAARPAGTSFARVEDLLEGGSAAPNIEVSYKDLCCLMYTSGTTGPSKGNMFTQIHTLTFGAYQIASLGLNEDDIYHIWAPLFHASGYAGLVLSSLMVGAGIALTRRLSARRFLQEVRESGATAAILLSIADFILAQPPLPDDRNHKLRFVIATPVPHNVAEFERRFGFHLTQGYGLSDFAMAFTQMLAERPDKRQSIGRVVEGVQARIVDDDDADVPVGKVGEIVLRKDWLPFAQAQGYYKMPEKTVEATRNQWFHTGDRGRVDEDAYFYFVDRKKDAIRRRGENISAYEVEVVIARHEAVMEVAVYAVNAGGSDEEVAACVVLKEGQILSEAELIAHCSASMPYYMVPRFLQFRQEIPKTTTQKNQKYLLRQELEQDLSTAWDREKNLAPHPR
jgi:carnitine-CoA ligase